MFKVVPGLSTTQCPPYINYYSKSDRSLDKLVPRKTNTTTLFIASAIRDWNSLPNRVVEEQSVEALKKAARSHV